MPKTGSPRERTQILRRKAAELQFLGIFLSKSFLGVHRPKYLRNGNCKIYILLISHALITGVNIGIVVPSQRQSITNFTCYFGVVLTVFWSLPKDTFTYPCTSWYSRLICWCTWLIKWKNVPRNIVSPLSFSKKELIATNKTRILCPATSQRSVTPYDAWRNCGKQFCWH